jgi:hypothetical protein
MAFDACLSRAQAILEVCLNLVFWQLAGELDPLDRAFPV